MPPVGDLPHEPQTDQVSRPWLDDFNAARTPAKAAAAVLDLVLASPVDPATYGELVRDGKVLPWRG